MLRIDRILVPIDFSQHAEEAFAYAGELAAAHGAELDLLHVVEVPTFPSFYSVGYAALYGETPDSEKGRREVETQARALLEKMGADLELRTDFEVRKGPAAEEIIRYAEEHDTDLIVIASHGLTGLTHLLMGSVAEKVVRGAPCPVFVVKVFGKSLLERTAADRGENVQS